MWVENTKKSGFNKKLLGRTFIYVFIWGCAAWHVESTCGILVPRPGIKPVSPAVEAESKLLNHRKVSGRTLKMRQAHDKNICSQRSLRKYKNHRMNRHHYAYALRANQSQQGQEWKGGVTPVPSALFAYGEHQPQSPGQKGEVLEARKAESQGKNEMKRNPPGQLEWRY